MGTHAWGTVCAVCLALLGLHALTSAFVPLCTSPGSMKLRANQHTMYESGKPVKVVSRRPASPHTHNLYGNRNEQQSPLAAGLVLSILAVVGAARGFQRNSSTQSNAVCSSSSGFLGSPAISPFAVVPVETPAVQAPQSQGVAGMSMRNQVWWIKSTGFDGHQGGKIFDWKRRESRRRGEELFRHDVDNFELCVHNLISAPGSRKKKIRRGRGQYGNRGRTCGYGTGGAKKRGRRTINPGYEGGGKPMHIRAPILTKEQRDSMKRDPFTPVELSTLNLCEDGEEVDYMDLFIRGLPVDRKLKFDRVKVKGTDEDEFNVKNLTVYAHAFEPPAREKIEKNGGRCVRLHEWSNLPLDEGAIRGLPSSGQEAAESAQD